MPATFEYLPDLTIEAGRNLQYNFQGVLVYGQIDRACFVRVISGGVAATLAAEAEAFIQTKIPITTPDISVPVCTARQIQTRPFQSADDALVVIVSYIYNQPAWDATAWTIESDSYTEQEETDVQYDPADSTQTKLIPIIIKNYILDWLDPTQPLPTTPASGTTPTALEAPQSPAFGLVVVPRRAKRWTYTKQIYSRDAAYAYDNATDQYIGRLNSAIFTGVNQAGVAQNRTDAPGTVFCADAGLRYSPYQGQYIAYAQIIFKPEGWQPYARYVNSSLGIIDNLWRPGSKPGSNPIDTTPGGTLGNGNGVVRTTAIPTADLNALLALI